jgi:predicted enzyme related to lactoylglutathione lyase
MTEMANRFSELQHLSGDPHKAKEFYQRLFGWRMTEQEIPGHGPRIETQQTEGPGGSFMQSRAGEASRWAVFINVDDLRGTLSKAKELGATVLQEPTRIPHAGTLAVLADPLGAVFKLWQPEASR